MTDKQYYITIPGSSKIATWDEERYERNKDELFKDHPDAKVATVSPVNPDDDINDTDSFQLSLNGVPAGSGLWSGEKLKRNSAQLLQDHPDVQINRVQPVNYWGDKLTDTYNRIEALNKEYNGLGADKDIPKTPRLTDAASIQRMNEQANSPERKRKREIKDELKQLYAEKENNPVYKEYWKSVNASLDEDYTHIDDALKQLKADNPEAERDYNYARYTGNGMGSGAVNPYVGKSDKDYNSARESLVAARLMLEDAKKTASAPTRYADKTGFWRAVADGAPDAVSIARLTKAGLNMHLIDAIKKIQDKAGEQANIMQMAESGAIDNLDYLNVGEKELVKAFAKKAEVEGAQSEKIGNESRSRISRRYQAGQSTAQSLGFMADFLMYGGFGEAVAEKAAGRLVEGAARGTLKKLGAETLSGTIKAMAMTPVMPSSYAMLQDNMLRFNDKGGVDLSGKAIAKAIGDVVIENVSETVGSKPMDLIGLPLNKVKFPNWAKALRNSPVAATMKQAGYNGFFEEIVEEWTGNALRVVTGVDKDALKDFATVDQQLITAGSFAPMALFSLPTTAVQYGVASKAQSNTKAQLLDIMDKTKMSDDDKHAALNMIDQLETPQELGQHMSQVYKQMVENGGNPAEAYEAVLRHTINASRYKVMVGAMDEQEDIKRSEDLLNLNNKMQGRQFWMDRGEGNNKQQVVRRITDAEGNEAYVVGGDAQSLAVVYPDGTNRYINISDLEQGVQDGTMTDTGEMAMNDYLNLDIKEKEQTTEQTRMQTERDTQLNEVRSRLVPGNTVNVGTAEAPVTATIIQLTPDGVILQLEDSTTDQRSFEDMAAVMGTPVTSKTDAELEQDEVNRVEYMNDIKAKADNIAKAGGRLTRDGQDYSVFAVLGWQDSEQGEPQLKVFVRNSNTGENEQLMLSTDEVAQFIGTNEAAGVLERTEPTKKEVEEGPHDIYHDFRNNPLPLKEDGSVDENALWNNDPEAWARWNDERNNDNGADSNDYINAAIGKLQQDAEALMAQRKTELDFTKRNAIDKQLTDIAGRVSSLRDVLERHNQPATAGNNAVTQRIADWQQKLGVKINSYSTLDEIPDERVRKEMQSGRVHTAWYDPKSDSVNFFLPNIADAKMVDSAVLHEVIAHKGLRQLLGSNYDTLLDRVYNELMDDKARQYYSGLVTRTASRKLSEQQTQRMAADEFIAYMAQDMDLSTEESQTLWQRLCEFVKDILDRLNVGGDLTIDDLRELLQASMTSYIQQNGERQQSVLDRIPTTTDKKGSTTYNWEAAPDAATALAGLREAGYEDSLIRQFAKNRSDKLREEKKRLEKRNPATIEELKAVNDQLKENTRIHMFWNDIVALMNKESKEQETRRKDVINTDTTGLPGITERFNAGKRLQGMATTRTLAGGLKIKGHFELVESGAVTPSHNPETFRPTEGYPTNENGSSINDRDYEHDEAAQQSVRQKAGIYDQRAYQEPVIVSRDGVVLSGNDRTMAGMIAADKGTDTQYVESLMQDAPMYGFTDEQVKQYAHPRLVFVLDEDMPYTTETMAMFNQSERKTQNKTEQMVKSGKAVKDTTFAKLADVVSRFDNTADMYRDQTASAELMKVLMADGVLNQQDVEQYMDNGILSRAGQEYIESLIIGYLFNGRDTTVRRLMADGMGNVRRSIVGSLAALTANRTLGEYSLQDIMEDAIAICYEAHKGFGGNVGDYLRQRNLFESDNTESYLYLAKWFAIYLNSGSLEVRAVLDIYNRSYADSAGIEDVFGGRTAQDAIKEITAYIQNRYNDEIQGRTAENGNTADQRSQLEGSPENRTGNQTGTEGTEQGGPVRDSDAQNGTAVTPTDREWAAVKLIEAGADARLPELMSDEEIAEFTDEYEDWEQFNDELGQLYIDLDGDLKSTDKAIKTAAQRRIDTQQALVVRRFKPIEDMVRNLTAKYNLSEEDFIEQTQENPEDEIVTDKLEEAPKYEEGASEKEIQATKFTQDEWEQFVYGGIYITYKSERTGETLEPVMIDDAHFPIYGDHRVIVWRWKTSEYKDRSEATATADYIVKYLKANRFRATETKYVKNQYGFWTEGGHNGCSNPLFVRLPSVKKSQYSSSTYIQYFRDDDGLWDISGSADYEMGGGSLSMSRHLFNTKSDALRAAIVALENFRKEHPGNHYNLKDVDNLIEHLKTKVLPLAMKEDGEIDVVPDTLAVQGELFTFDNRADKQPKKGKAKTKKETKKPAAKKAAPKKVVQTDEGEDETEETNGRKVEPTETISFPDSENRIYLYEQGGKWESKVEVHADNGNMSGGPANPSNYPYNTREDAIRHALNYAQWYAKNIAGGTGIGHTGIDRFVEQVNLTQIQSAEPTAPAYGSQNTIITADKYEELKRKMREKLSNLNVGFDPEVFFIGAQMAAFHVEAGARKFVDFAKRMIEDLGDAIRPYLKSIYNGARDLPGMEPYRDDMDSAADVDAIDVNAITLDEQAAETVEETQEEVTEEEETETETETEPEQQAEDELDVHEGDLVVLKKKPQGFDGALKVVGRNTDGTYNLEYNPTGFLPVTMMNVDADDFIPFVRHHREDISEQRREVEAQQPQESAPAAEQTAGKTVGEIGTYTHTKTGREMSIVRLTGDRLSADEFKELKARAKELGGYYSSYGGAKGFLFDNVEDATKFNNLEYETEQTDEQTATDTAAIVSQAASVAEQAQSIAQTEEPAEPERAAETITAIDEQLDKIDGQLALLGYYTADTSDRSKFHESYGYMKSAEEKARKDAEKLARKLAADLGIEVDKKRIAKTNVAPAGGDVTFRLPLKEGRELYVNIEVTPTTVAEYNSYMRGEDYLPGYGDDLAVGVGPMGKNTAILYRVENTNGVGGFERYGSNNFAPYNVTYQDLLSGIRRVAREFLPEQVETPAAATAQSVDEKAEKPSKTGKSKKKEVNSQSSGDGLMGDLFADIYHMEDEQEENEPAPQDAAVNAPAKEVVTELNGYKIGDRVLYTDYTGKTQEATIYEFDGGRPVLDSGFAPVMYELVEWDNIKPIDNGLEGNDAVRTQGLPADNTRPAEGEGGSAASVPETDRQEAGGADRAGESGGQSGEQPGGSVRRIPRLSGQNKRNNHVSKGEAVYPKTPAARFKANIAAIRLLKELQTEGKQATKEQMAVLRQFTGWGGLGGYFNNSYSEENRELRSLLTGDEFDAAQLSINTAYYTPTEIIDTLWDVAAKLGFQGGKILEGSAGIGNILASIPKGMNEASQITAVELDNITGGILEQLYPDAQVYIRGFETVDIDNASVDLAITNVPFGENLKIYDAKEKDLTRLFGSKIHDFCIAKNIRKLRPGGVGIFISSRGTLDSSSRKLRQWIVNEGGCDVIGAFRLNNETFVGTGATADIIVVRKRVNNQVSPDAIDVTGTEVVRSEEYETGETEYNRKEHRFEPIIGRATMEMNTYFTQHPEYMGGEMAFGFEKGNTYRAGSAALYPSDKIDQAKRLKKWVSQMKEYEPMEVTPAAMTTAALEDTQGVKEGQLIVNSKGEICQSRRGKAVPVPGINSNKVKGKYTKAQVLADYDALKAAIKETLDYQLKNESDEGLQPLLKKLNRVYDDFVKKYGYLTRNASISFLKNDVEYSATEQVEIYKEKKDMDGKVTADVKKAQLFYVRQLNAPVTPTPETVQDGVIVSMNQFGRINIPFIAQAMNLSEDKVREDILAAGVGFEEPASGEVVIEYEYLSGNVREKLEYANEHNTDGRYDNNIKALQNVIPADIPAHLIEFSLGSDWLPVSLYVDYAREKFGVNDRFQPVKVGGSWQLKEDSIYYIDGRNEQNRSAGVTSNALNMTVYGHELMIAAMNNKTVEFKKTETVGDEKETRRDKEATAAATTKMNELRDDFKEWARQKMQGDEELAAHVSKIYNDLFNAMVPKQIRDIYVPEHFNGMANVLANGKPLSLRPHQARAVIRSTTEPVILAHEVGTGKTFTLITAAMEMRRLGTAKKPMIVVQNATLGQFVSSAKELYPSARILTLSEQDHTAEGRGAFYAKIRYNDWDLIIVPQSVFEMMPDSEERRRAFIQSKIEEKEYILSQVEQSGDQNVRRSLQQEIADLKYEYETGEKPTKNKKKDSKRQAESINNTKVKAQRQLDRRTDDVSNFDEMGIDALLIDEAHAYKHLGFATAMQRGVKGVDVKSSKRSAGVFLKTRSIFDRVGWKNVVFATGTPISNTAAEIWTFMKYLLPDDFMWKNHIYYFDDFVRNFGSIQQNLEFTISGKFKETTRFAAYSNLPELVRIWMTIADVVLTKEAVAGGGETLNDKVPRMEDWTDEKGEKHENQVRDIYLPQSASLTTIMAAVRAELERFENMSGKEKQENRTLPLNMFTIAKKAAIDTRLVSTDSPDEPQSKTNSVVEETLKALEDSKRYKGTCALFCDIYQRKDFEGGRKVTRFNLFDEIKRKLIARGVPADQIIIMESGMSTAAKEKIFAKVNNGEIRVIMGTTATLGTGVNIQERLFFEAHLDAPDRPMDYTQRMGRILRQGNLHKEWGIPVRVIRFGVEDSLDVTAYQRLSTKSKFINSVMDSKHLLQNGMEDRVLEEEEEGEFDNPVAILSGSEYALLKTQAERELRKLQSKKEQHRQDQIYIENKLKKNNTQLGLAESNQAKYQQALDNTIKAFPDGIVKEIAVEGVKCKDDKAVAAAVKAKIQEPISAIIADLRRLHDERHEEKHTYTMTFDGVKANVIVNMVSTYGYDFNKGEFNTKVSSQLQFVCDECGFTEPVDMPGGYTAAKDIVEYFKLNVANGSRMRHNLELLSEHIDRLKKDNELMLARKGKPFTDEDKLKEQTKLVEDLTEKMKVELAAKEAKYAEELKKNPSSFVLHTELADEDINSDDDSTPSYQTVTGNATQILDYYENPDGIYSYMSEEGLVSAVEMSNVLMDDERVRDLVDEYRRLDAIDREEGRRDLTGGEMQDLVEFELLPLLREIAEQEQEQLGVKISGQPSGNVRGAKKVLTDNQVKMLSYVTGMNEDEIRTLNDEGDGLSAENAIFASNNRTNERGTVDIQRQTGRTADSDAGRRADAVRRSGDSQTGVPSEQSTDDIVKPLRKLEPGETCLVERKLSEAGDFSFIGRDRIESLEDVAYIFRKLETKAVENSFIVFVKDGKPTVLHVGMGHIDAVNVDLSPLTVMMKEIKPDKVYFVHNHPSGNIISSTNDRKLWAEMQKILGKKLEPGIIIDTTRGVYGTYMDEFDSSMPENFTGREGDVKIPTYRFDEIVFSKDYDPVRGERILTSRDVAAYVSSHRLGERDKISVLCINRNNIVVGNFFLPYTGLDDVKTINKIAVDCAYYAGITNAPAVVVYGSGVDPRTTNQLDTVAGRIIKTFLNANGTILLDMVGGETANDGGLYNYYSYKDHGRLSEPDIEYGGSADEIRYQTVEPTDYEDSAADMTERSKAVGANLGVGVEVINEPKNSFKSSYQDGKLTINIGSLNGDSPLEAALMAMSREMPLSDILGGDAVREFAQQLYRELPEFRQKVVEIAQQSYGWDTARAMMEYLGSMAESTTDDAESQDTWSTIETAFNDMLDKVLDKAPMGWKWVEGRALRYILFQNAHQGDKSIATIARGAALAHNQGLSVADNEIRTDGAQAARVQQAQERTVESAANLYNRVVSRMWSRMDETYRDQFQSVNTLVDALEKASGKKAQGFEDIRKSLNQQSSKGLAAMQKWEREHWDKMMKAVQAIIDERGLSYDEVERYLMLKHGVERNDVFAKRDARAFYQAIHDAKVTSIQEFAKQHPDVSDEEIKKRISREDDILDRHFVAIESGTDSKYKELREKDYGGLTGLYSKYENINPYDPTTETQEEYEKRLLAARKPMFDNMTDMELAADAEIADFEKRMGSDLMTELWNQINGATKAVLKHQYDANMMSRGQYEHVRDMFKYYVPLRGFAETTPEDMYSYYTSNADATFVAPLKQAKGRKTRAESPLAYIGAMASSAIAADIKNESKLALYYFVSNRQANNDLVLVSDVWYVKQVDENGDALLDDEGRTIFEPQYPPFTEALSTDQAKAEYEQWENEMKQLAREHRAFRGVRELDKQRLNYVVNTSKQQVKSHIIAFKLGGRDMFMFINGNPRAAQAINGELNVDASKNEFTKATLKFLRAFASLNTSLNPEFWLSNLQRDTLFALMSVNIKEDKAYNEAFRKNLKQALKVVRMKRDLQNGKLGTGELEQNYRSFVENGGVTGYTSVRGTDVWEAEIKKYTGDTRTAIERAGAALDAVQEFGESFEQMTRFAAYLTSREQGKSVVESVADAKELTVNFNRKGSGKGITWKESEFLRTREGRKLNDIERLFAVSASMLSVYGRHAIMFFNASVQGLNAMYQLAQKDKSKLGLWVGGYLMLGAMNAVLHAMLDGDGDDDDQYLDVPDYERRNNMLLGLKGVYLKWALPQEARVFYGMGDMIVNHSLGREPHRNIVGEVASMIGEIAPLDATSGLAAVLPSITTPVVEVIQNEDYKGARVYNDNRFLSDEEKKHIPAYRDPLKNTSKVYLALSEALNWISGGNEYEAGAVNWNPNIMEHIVEGYTGGLGTTVGKGLKFMENALGGEVKISDTPFLRRLMTWNDDRYRNAHVTDLYYYYREVAQDTERRLKEAMKAGDEKQYKKVTGSYDYKVLEVWKRYEKEMDAYDKYLRLIDVKDRKQRKQITREHDALRARMIRDISDLK